MVGMARMGQRRTSQGEKGVLRWNYGATELRSYGNKDSRSLAVDLRIQGI